MGKRRFGGKRRPLLVECRQCGRHFMWLSSGVAYEPGLKVVGPDVKIVFTGTRKEYFQYQTYKLSDYQHECGGRLRRLSIPDPMRKVVGQEAGYEVFECGHRQFPRQDIFGYTNAVKRQCRECGKALRLEAVKAGRLTPFEAGLL